MTPSRNGRVFLAVAVAWIGSAFELPAQAHRGPEGEWSAVWASAVRSDGDSLLVQRQSSAHLLLERRGDALTGAWSTEVGEAETWVITGSFTDRVLRMEARSTVDGTLPGEGPARLTRIEWSGTLSENGDALEGEMWFTLETPRGVRRSPPRPWTARRGPDSDEAAGVVSPTGRVGYPPRSHPPSPSPPWPPPPGRRRSPS